MKRPTPCLLPTHPASREVLLASGITPRMIRTHLADGSLVRLRQGVFVAAAAIPADPAARHILAAHAEQVVHPDAVVSHNSAAAIWQLPHPAIASWHDDTPTVTLAGTHLRRGPATRYSAPLAPGHVTRDPDGYPVTTVARTVIDLAADLDLPQALVLCDAGARRLIEAMVLRPRRVEFAHGGLVKAARDQLYEAAGHTRGRLDGAISLTDPRRESPPESLSAGHFHLAGLPAPVSQHCILTEVGRLYPDFYWPDANLIGECDGAVKYSEPSAYVDEKVREQVLRDMGFRIVRWLAREILVTPHLVVDRVGRALSL